MSTQQKANDVMNIESKFYTSLGNGKAALAYAVDMVKSVADSRDTTVLTRAIKRAMSKGDDKAAGSLRFMIRHVWPGVKATKNKKTGDITIKISGIEHEPEAIETLDALVADGVSLRGTLLTQAFMPKDKPAFDPMKQAQRFTKSHNKAQVTAYIAALQALSKEMES